MWNGYVDDWMNFELVENILVKKCESLIRFGIEMEWKEKNQSWEIPADVQQRLDEIIKQQVKEQEWEIPYKDLDEEGMKRWYGKHIKKTIFINTKQRNKNSYDRLGKISY
jgi:hypothetical protein